MKTRSDQDIFELLKSGSEKAFREVYNDNRQLFINFGRKYSLENEDLLDIYQDSCIVLYENIQSGKLKDLSSSLSTYLISIGKYKILETLRKKKLTVESEDFLKSLKVEEEIKDFVLNEQVLTNEQVRLRNCFSKLGRQCQTVLNNFYYRGMSIKEIRMSESYNSDNVVKAQKSRCLKQLKECVKLS